MAEELDDITLAHGVLEFGMPENLVSPLLNDFDGEKDSDHFVEDLNVNVSASEEGEVTMGNEEVFVQNESGIDVSHGVEDIEYFDFDNGGEEGDKEGGFLEVVKPSVEAGEKGMEDFRDALMEMDSEVGYYVDNADDTEEKLQYSVGDLVWGKIRSHPWWPGQIYDPDDASDDALKLKQKGRYLVAYYGDASFSWCLPSQLIPFAENFEKMSAQNSLKTFVRAVQQAVDEIGRLVELDMTCSCVPLDYQKGITRPLAVNAGIKSGVIVPDGDIGKLLSFRYDPSEVLLTVSGMAQSVSFACSSLELSILKGWLSAFYRARGGFTLPVYYEPPLFVLGLLEGYVQSNVDERNELIVPVEVPLQIELKRGADVIPKSRKRVPVEVPLQIELKSGADVIPKSRKRVPVEVPLQIELKSGADVIPKSRKRVTSDKVKRKRKSDGSGLRKEKMQDRCLIKELEEAGIPIGESIDNEGSKGYKDTCSMRPRRKSKYLSPPFTSYDRHQVAESEEMVNITTVAEHMKAAAEQLLNSTPPSMNSVGSYSKKIIDSSPLSMFSVGTMSKKIIDAVNAVESENEFLSRLVSIASSLVHPWNIETLDLTREFFLAFRSSIYLKEENYKLYHNMQEDEDLAEHLAQTDNNTGAKKRKEKPSSTSSKISTAEKLYTPKRKKTDVKDEANCIGLEKNASLTSSLVLTIPPGSSLPSKDDIMKFFSKYGHVNEEETVVYSNYCRVKILHENSVGVDAALRDMLQEKPLGSATVDYKICYSSAASAVAVASDSATAPAVVVGSDSVAPVVVVAGSN